MIGVKIVGGLGNQMFQYALGRAIAEKAGTPLYLDIEWYYNIPDQDTPRTFDLNCYDIKGHIFRSDDTSPFFFHKLKPLKRVLRKLKQKGILPAGELFVEKKTNFDQTVLERNGKTYFDGYWQSPKYFQEIREILLSEFRPVDLSDEDLELCQEIKKHNSISIHIRRGDYISNDIARTRHLVCDKDYYDRALQTIKEKVDNPKIYFFSDDPDWVKQEFNEENSVVIEGNNNRPWLDLHLMSCCQHHIIANSSFSWWGAWLAEKEGVNIAPKKWFANGEEMNDLIPETWIRI